MVTDGALLLLRPTATGNGFSPSSLFRRKMECGCMGLQGTELGDLGSTMGAGVARGTCKQRGFRDGLLRKHEVTALTCRKASVVFLTTRKTRAVSAQWYF